MLQTMDLSDDDASLMLRYRDGDAAAFAALYAHYKGPLYRYLLRHVRNACAAADLFQEVWSHLIATRARYEPRAKFATFLFHIAHNCAIDFFRRDSNLRRVLPAYDSDSQLPEAEVPEHQRPGQPDRRPFRRGGPHRDPVYLHPGRSRPDRLGLLREHHIQPARAGRAPGRPVLNAAGRRRGAGPCPFW